MKDVLGRTMSIGDLVNHSSGTTYPGPHNIYRVVGFTPKGARCITYRKVYVNAVFTGDWEDSPSAYIKAYHSDTLMVVTEQFTANKERFYDEDIKGS